MELMEGGARKRPKAQPVRSPTVEPMEVRARVEQEPAELWRRAVSCGNPGKVKEMEHWGGNRGLKGPKWSHRVVGPK